MKKDKKRRRKRRRKRRMRSRKKRSRKWKKRSLRKRKKKIMMINGRVERTKGREGRENVKETSCEMIQTTRSWRLHLKRLDLYARYISAAPVYVTYNGGFWLPRNHHYTLHR